MIEFLKSNFSQGDPIQITTDTNTVRGQIEFIGPDYIVLRLASGQVMGISESTIRTFSSVSDINEDHSGEMAQESAEEHAPEETEKPSEKAEPAKPFKKYKPGDRVPLEVLTERDPSLLHNWSKKKETKRMSEAAVEGIRKAYDEAKEAKRKEDETVLPPTGKIVQLRPSYQFGFIDKEDGRRYFFNRADIIDSKLRDFSGEGIEVTFLPSSNHKGLTAKSIVRPQSISTLLDIVMERAAQGDLIRSKGLLTLIIEKEPKNASTLSMLEALNQVLHKSGTVDEDEESTAYNEGNQYLSAKEYEKALEAFHTSIEEGKRVEQSIKQSISAYVQMYTSSEDLEERESIRRTALDFIREKEGDLPNNINSLFVLENAYFALGEYSSHIEVIEEVINFCAKRRDLPKYLFYLRKAAQSYYRLGDFARALDTAQEGLEREPEDEQLLKLRDLAQDELNVRLKQ